MMSVRCVVSGQCVRRVYSVLRAYNGVVESVR